MGLPIFLGIMWAVYYICIQTLGDETIGWMEELFEGISEYAGALLEAAGASEVMSGLVLDGIIGGVGAVLGFVPQICLLFLFCLSWKTVAIWHVLLLLWIVFSGNSGFQASRLFRC